MGKDWLRRKTGTLASRVLFGVFAITLAVLMTVSVILFFWFRGQMVKEYRRLTKATISNIDLVFDNDIKSARNMLTQWFSSSGGTLCRLQGDYYMYKNMTFVENVRVSLGHIPYLHSVYFFSKERELSFLVEAGIPYTGDITEILMEEMEKRTSNSSLWPCRVLNRFVGKEDIELLTLSMWEAPISSTGFSGAALLNLDAAAFSKSLFSGNIGEDMELFIVDKNGTVIVHSDPDRCGEYLGETEFMQVILEGVQDSFVTEMDGKLWDINWIPSAQKGFYVIAQNDYHKGVWQVSQVATIALFIILMAAVIILAVTWPVCKRIFRPLEEVILNMKKTTDVRDGGDEVTFLSQYYQNTQESIRELASKEEDSFIAKNLLLGNQSAGVQELLLKKGAIHRQKGYFMAIIYIQDNADAVTGMQEYDMLRRMVREIFSLALEQIGLSTCYELGVKRLLFLISAENEPDSCADDMEEKAERFRKDMLAPILRKACNTVLEQSGYSLTVILSNPAQNGETLCTVLYKDIEERLHTWLLLEGSEGEDNDSVICPDDGDWKSIGDLQKAIISAVKEQKEEVYLTELNRFYAACTRLPYSTFSGEVLSVAMQIVEVREKTSMERGAISWEQLRKQFEQLQTKEELTAWFLKLYHAALLSLRKVNSHSNAISMTDAVDYIRNHYDDCMLNVNLLADRLHLSAPYFGKLFREFAGCSAVEYITRVRMEKAHDLLLAEPEKDVGRIAREVGYNNNAYFATAFKKYFGVSPSKLRDYHVVQEKKGDSRQNQ